MKTEKFYSQGNDWMIRFMLNWSHRGMHRKEMDATLKPGFENTKLILQEAILQDLKEIGGQSRTVFSNLFKGL
jgi:hypothetical protein